MRRDHDAVLAAIGFPWSQGQVEDQVLRLKLLKYLMDGRVSFAVLRGWGTSRRLSRITCHTVPYRPAITQFRAGPISNR